MTRNWIGRLLAISLLTMPFVAAAQTSDDAAMMGDTAMSGPLSPTAMKAMIWTDKLGYSTGEQMNVY
ncbi:MAG: hypothetical protein OXN87_14400, partial [Chloroflexota bacterium]|nr:hypothetical protein [Chloroflexota bacterium]